MRLLFVALLMLSRGAVYGDNSQVITIMFSGDIMTGRGIDQVLEHPSDPQLYESYVKDARQYVQLAEAENGNIEAPVADEYIWGSALAALERVQPDIRVINLETSITADGTPWPGKGIHYRMHPRNIGCLTAANVDVCTLANNHVLDWGYPGLSETVETLRTAGIHTAGAGNESTAAAAPAVVELSDNERVLVFSYAHRSSGVPSGWPARPEKSGINFVPDFSTATVERIRRRVRAAQRPGDIVVLSIHWGGNWGYAIAAEHVRFAHDLIDSAGVDIVHGHSSHHFLPSEIYKGRLILYGCGDLINDYEGIGGHEEYRSELSLIYTVKLRRSEGELVDLTMLPFRMKRFSLHQASSSDIEWIARTLNEKGLQLGTEAVIEDDGKLRAKLSSVRGD